MAAESKLIRLKAGVRDTLFSGSGRLALVVSTGRVLSRGQTLPTTCYAKVVPIVGEFSSRVERCWDSGIRLNERRFRGGGEAAVAFRNGRSSAGTVCGRSLSAQHCSQWTVADWQRRKCPAVVRQRLLRQQTQPRRVLIWTRM